MHRLRARWAGFGRWPTTMFVPSRRSMPYSTKPGGTVADAARGDAGVASAHGFRRRPVGATDGRGDGDGPRRRRSVGRTAPPQDLRRAGLRRGSDRLVPQPVADVLRHRQCGNRQHVAAYRESGPRRAEAVAGWQGSLRIGRGGPRRAEAVAGRQGWLRIGRGGPRRAEAVAGWQGWPCG